MITSAMAALVGQLTKIDTAFRYKTSNADIHCQGTRAEQRIPCNRASKFDPRLSFRVIDFSPPTFPSSLPPPPPPPSSSSSYS